MASASKSIRKKQRPARRDSRIAVKVQAKIEKNRVEKPLARLDSTRQSAEGQSAEKKARTFALPRGMRDLLPRDETVWRALRETAAAISRAYGFSELQTPIVEENSLFVRSIGRGTDVVEKEMYAFEDRDGTRLALRPEATVGMARAFLLHGMHHYPQPVKLWQLGPMFRHDRPQAGRYRQFYQWDCEIFGGCDPVIDAELIVMAYNFLRDLGIEACVEINSIGSREDRERYVAELLGYLRAKRAYLCEDCKRRLVKNPLRALDCNVASCQSVMEEAPQIINWLSEPSKQFFLKVLEYLDELSIPYFLRHTLVRGLDYYTDTVFELYAAEDTAGLPPAGNSTPGASGRVADDAGAAPAEEAARRVALGGGGRYDGLIAELGGPPTPGVGFALGLDRIALLLKGKGETLGRFEEKRAVFFAQLGEGARRHALGLIEDLRRAGIFVGHQLGKASLKGQFEYANKLKATHTVILGQKEVQDGTIIVRDMESGIQEIIDQKKLISTFRDIAAKHAESAH